MISTYILNGRTHEACDDLLEWARWMATAERHVAHDTIDGVRVSTVFLGLDHQFGNGPPLLFETMIFGGEDDGYQERYATWEEAEAGHVAALEKVRGR
jgi:hypothetical protein